MSWPGASSIWHLLRLQSCVILVSGWHSGGMWWRWAVIVVIWCCWWWLALTTALLWLIGDGWASQTANSGLGEQIGFSVACGVALGLASWITYRLLRSGRDPSIR